MTLFRDEFDKRAREMYQVQRSYARAVYEDKVLVKPAIPVEFNFDEFHLWLFREIGQNAKPCPYCGTPIDVYSCQLDHKVPRAQGGAMSLLNLMAICARCNTLKGNMTAKSFRLLMDIGRTMAPKDWEYLCKRIIIGGTAQQQRWQAIRAQRELKKVKGTLPRRTKPQPADDLFF